MNVPDDLCGLPRVLGVYPEGAPAELPQARGARRVDGPKSPGNGEARRTLLFVVGGLHGNEPAGVRAIRAVLEELRRLRPPVEGRIVGLAGNIAALAQGKRFLAQDLNRLWTEQRLGEPSTRNGDPESREQRALLEVFREHLREPWVRVVLLDLHSTSAGGAPFSIVSDTLQSRPIAFALPVPVLLGLEERVVGTLLAWFADQGHVSLCLEGGQNELLSTVDHHVAALWLTLVSTGLLAERDVPDLAAARARLANSTRGLPRVVEIRYRYAIPEGAHFEMQPGFHNFQPVRRGEVLARTSGAETRAVASPLSARLLMPRYQSQGDDGFFLGREVRPFWLRLSGLLRRLRLGWIPRFLPGVRASRDRAGELVVDRRIARWFTVEILHLFGYRWRARSGSSVVFVRRPDAPTSISRGRSGDARRPAGP